MVFKSTNNTRVSVRKKRVFVLFEPCILFTDPPVFSILGQHRRAVGAKGPHARGVCALGLCPALEERERAWDTGGA